MTLSRIHAPFSVRSFPVCIVCQVPAYTYIFLTLCLTFLNTIFNIFGVRIFRYFLFVLCFLSEGFANSLFFLSNFRVLLTLRCYFFGSRGIMFDSLFLRFTISFHEIFHFFVCACGPVNRVQCSTCNPRSGDKFECRWQPFYQCSSLLARRSTHTVCPMKTGRALHGFVPAGIARTTLRGDTSRRGRFSLFFHFVNSASVLCELFGGSISPVWYDLALGFLSCYLFLLTMYYVACRWPPVLLMGRKRNSSQDRRASSFANVYPCQKAPYRVASRQRLFPNLHCFSRVCAVRLPLSQCSASRCGRWGTICSGTIETCSMVFVRHTRERNHAVKCITKHAKNAKAYKSQGMQQQRSHKLYKRTRATAGKRSHSFAIGLTVRLSKSGGACLSLSCRLLKLYCEADTAIFARDLKQLSFRSGI